MSRASSLLMRFVRRAGRGLLALGACALALPAQACEPSLAGAQVRKVDSAAFTVAWVADPAPLKTGEFFAVEAAVCANTGAVADLRVDAVMPEHKHGMNYRPEVKAAGNGRFRAEGLLLHMPGLWEFSFDVRGEAKREVLKDRVRVE